MLGYLGSVRGVLYPFVAPLIVSLRLTTYSILRSMSGRLIWSSLTFFLLKLERFLVFPLRPIGPLMRCVRPIVRTAFCGLKTYMP